MLKFFLGMLAGAILLWVIFIIIGSYKENTRLKEKLNDYEKEMNENQNVVCHCNVKDNADLIAKILDDDNIGKVYTEVSNEQTMRIGF